jgi:hypothetical protein
VFLEIQQLLSAEDSPMPPVKKKYVPSVAEIIGQGDDAPVDRSEGHLREPIACIEDPAVAARHRHLPCSYIFLDGQRS